ncbi:MAG TPA: SDR family oxidoreductase [Phaeodactylibacter sp.]|nr:SDR family oxidoreductase [Phaeodactylibacter sp.]
MEAPLLLLEDEMIEQMIDVNFRSPLYLSKAVLKHMIRKKSGNIVNISSASTHAWGRGIVVYASAKAALERLTQTLAQEVGKKNIRINAVCPGVVDTKMSSNLRSVAGDIITMETALKRYGHPKEISKAVLFLASEETASFITGVVLNVDGGFNL